MDLTKFNPTVSQYFIDPNTRVCFNGKFCYDCLVPKFPGYAPSGQTDTDATIMKMSRGELRLIEYDATDYGFSYVTNGKSEIEFTNSSLNTALTHATWGNTRNSFGKWYIQNRDSSTGHLIYALHKTSGTIAFETIYTTTETTRHSGHDKAVWWPIHNMLLVRQLDEITWDGYGLNVDSIAVAATPANYLPDQLFEPFSTGPIHIDGDMPLEARFCNNYLVVWRENTRHGDNRLSMYSWSKGHFATQVEKTVSNSNTATSLVSFGTDGALVWNRLENTGVLYGTDASTTTISVEITDSTLSTAWSTLVTAGTHDLRLIQARPDPDNPTENPTVYAFFTDNTLFQVTLDTANTKIVLNPAYTLDTRFKLYQPLDIGHIYLANMVVHGATSPTTDTDMYSSGAVCVHKLDNSTTITCTALQTSESAFN